MFRFPGPLVYGTIMVGALLDAESFKLESFGETIGGIAITMVLIWLAHTYAQITAERMERGERLSWSLVGSKMAHELSILTGAAIPLLVVVIWWLTGGELSGALTAGIWAAALTVVAIEVLAALEAKLSAAECAIQIALGVILGVGILVLKLVYH